MWGEERLARPGRCWVTNVFWVTRLLGWIRSTAHPLRSIPSLAANSNLGHYRNATRVANPWKPRLEKPCHPSYGRRMRARRAFMRRTGKLEKPVVGSPLVSIARRIEALERAPLAQRRAARAETWGAAIEVPLMVASP